MPLEIFLRRCKEDPKTLSETYISLPESFGKYDKLTQVYNEMSYYLDDWASYKEEERSAIIRAFLTLVGNINKWNNEWLLNQEDYFRSLAEEVSKIN